MAVQLHDYQQVAKNFLMNTPRAGLFLDVGFGKTITTLDTLQELGMLGKISGHILVIAPKHIARSTWIDEMDKWGIHATVVSLLVDYDPVRYQNELARWKEKVDLINKAKAIYPDPCDLKKNKGVTIDGVHYPPSKLLKPKATVTEAYYIDYPKKPPRDRELTRERRLELYEGIVTHVPAFYFINRELVCDLIDWHKQHKKFWPFPTVIIDELQSFKSYDSQRFVKMKSILPQITRFIGLTGTPTPNGLMDLWPEVYMMDLGARLGRTIGDYRRTYFDPGLTIHDTVVEWKPKPGAQAQIYQKIRDVVISIMNPNLKLPPITYNIVNCYMTDEERDLYKKMVKDNVLAFETGQGDQIEIAAENSAILSIKLSQMASGALYVSKDSKQYIKIHESKLEQMLYIIENTGSPVLVAYHFQSDLDLIQRYLTDHGHANDFKVFNGRPEMIQEWNEGRIPIMLLQPAAAGHGINIQDGGHTLIWYTIPWSLEHYIQTNGRLYRQGQKNPVMIHHLITDKTIDSRKLSTVNKKDMSERELMEAVAAVMDNPIAIDGIVRDVIADAMTDED